MRLHERELTHRTRTDSLEEVSRGARALRIEGLIIWKREEPPMGWKTAFPGESAGARPHLPTQPGAGGPSKGGCSWVQICKEGPHSKVRGG